MPLSTAGLNVAAGAVRTAATHVSLHTADPGATGANPSAAARQAATWNAVANGDFDLASTLNFTGGAASGACTHYGLWDAATSGNFLGGGALSGDQTFNAAGEYDVTEITVDID